MREYRHAAPGQGRRRFVQIEAAPISAIDRPACSPAGHSSVAPSVSLSPQRPRDPAALIGPTMADIKKTPLPGVWQTGADKQNPRETAVSFGVIEPGIVFAVFRSSLRRITSKTTTPAGPRERGRAQSPR